MLGMESGKHHVVCRKVSNVGAAKTPLNNALGRAWRPKNVRLERSHRGRKSETQVGWTRHFDCREKDHKRIILLPTPS